MKVVTAAEMAVLEKTAQNIYQIEPLILMENAGKEAAYFIANEIFKQNHSKRVTVVAGKGNNAGDGFVVARHLTNMGFAVKVVLLYKPEEMSGDALINFRIIKNMSVRMQSISTERDLQTFKIGLLYTDLIVDAVYGTGFKGGLAPLFCKVFETINTSGVPVLALDIPSGVEADTGKAHESAIRANWTLAMGLPKLGHFMNNGSENVGQLKVIDISLPHALLTSDKVLRSIITPELCKNLLPRREANSHKGTYGHLLVVGGSREMTGAIVLSALAAARSGCGLVTLCLPKSMQKNVFANYPYLMTKPLPEVDETAIAKDAFHVLEKIIAKVQALTVGPGLSRHPESMQFVEEVLANVKKPMVIDADALYALKDKTNLFKKSQAPLVITPHPGEMSLLTGQSVPEIQNNRLQVAENFAEEYGVTVVLKGHGTVIATPEGYSFLATTGNPGMAKGGSGDVLAGIIGALLAQGLKPKDAAVLGVYIHGRSGDICAAKLSMQGMHAGDIIENLPQSWNELEQ